MLSHHLDVGPFPYNFVIHSVMNLFLRADNDIECSRESVDVFKIELVNFSYAIFQFQYDSANPLGFD